MKNYNILRYGDAIAALNELDWDTPSNDDLRAALMNTLNRIYDLECRLELIAKNKMEATRLGAGGNS